MSNDTLHQDSMSARLMLGDLRMTKMEQDIAAIKESHSGLKAALEENTALTQSVKDAVETWQTVSRVSTWVGKAVRWAAGVIAAAVGAWQLLSNFKQGH